MDPKNTLSTEEAKKLAVRRRSERQTSAPVRYSEDMCAAEVLRICKVISRRYEVPCTPADIEAELLTMRSLQVRQLITATWPKSHPMEITTLIKVAHKLSVDKDYLKRMEFLYEGRIIKKEKFRDIPQEETEEEKFGMDKGPGYCLYDDIQDAKNNE